MIKDLRAQVRKYQESADRREITDFFLFGQKNPFGELFSEMISKGSISFFFLQNLQNLKIQPEGHQWRPRGLKFGTCSTCSYGCTKRCLEMSFTQCLWHLLSITRDYILFKNVSFSKKVNLQKPYHLRT